MDIHEEKREIERELYRRENDDRMYKLMRLLILGAFGFLSVYFGLIIWLISQR